MKTFLKLMLCCVLMLSASCTQPTVTAYNTYETGVMKYTKACALNNASGCLDLANSYYNGTDVTQDYAQAKIYYSKACDLKEAHSCNNLGDLYFEGKGIDQDYIQAKIYYIKPVI